MRIFVVVMLMSVLFPGIAAAASLEEDVAQYVAIFKGDKSGHNSASEALSPGSGFPTRAYST